MLNYQNDDNKSYQQEHQHYGVDNGQPVNLKRNKVISRALGDTSRQ